MKRKNLAFALTVCSLVAPMLFSPGCANTTQAPTGGPKDSIPPHIVMINPLPGVRRVPREGAVFNFEFNEYFDVKNAQNIFLSPPQAKKPKYKVKGKVLQVYFEEPLDSNTVYTIDFVSAIADKNEGNMFPGFTYVFTTGEQIDSLYITGTVLDCSNLEPVKDATVMLYTDLSDSAVFKHRPDKAVKTDTWGYFSLPYLKDTLYRIYAIVDASGNNIYDPSEDKIAFIDSLIRPVHFVNDTVKELKKYDMLDTLSCQARESMYELRIFRETPSEQFIDAYKRVGERSAYVSFNAQNAWIDSLWFGGYPSDRVITQFNIEQDSLELWLNDKKHGPDTLHLFINYRKTDTTGTMVPYLEHIKLFEEGLGRNAYRKYKKPSEIKHEDTICALTMTVKPETVEQNGFELMFKFPIIYENFDSIKFWSVNPRQEDAPEEFTIERDSINIRRYIIRAVNPMQRGYEYFLKLPHHAFMDITGFQSDSTQTKVALPTDDALSSLTLDCVGVDCKYIVDLLDEGMKTTYRQYIIDSDCSLAFPYLKQGKYCIRLTQDSNRNGIVDSGNLLEHRMPEKVKMYMIADKKQIIIEESTDITQTVDFKSIFEN